MCVVCGGRVSLLLDAMLHMLSMPSSPLNVPRTCGQVGLQLAVGCFVLGSHILLLANIRAGHGHAAAHRVQEEIKPLVHALMALHCTAQEGSWAQLHSASIRACMRAWPSIHLLLRHTEQKSCTLGSAVAPSTSFTRSLVAQFV